MEVYRHAGYPVHEDPRESKEYKKSVRDGLRLTELIPQGEYAHLTVADLKAIVEMIERKAAAFWVEGSPRTTVRYFQHDTIPTGPPCRLPPHNLKRKAHITAE